MMVLRRQVARPRHSAADRLVLATLAALLPRERWGIFLVTPSTWSSSWFGRLGRIPAGISADRRECRKLGVTVSATSVRSILRSRRPGPAPAAMGRAGQSSSAGRPSGTIACDFRTVETIGLTRLYVLFVIELEHRRVSARCLARGPVTARGRARPGPC